MAKVDAATNVMSENDGKLITQKSPWHPKPVPIKPHNPFAYYPALESVQFQVLKTKDLTPTYDTLHKHTRFISSNKGQFVRRNGLGGTEHVGKKGLGRSQYDFAEEDCNDLQKYVIFKSFTNKVKRVDKIRENIRKLIRRNKLQQPTPSCHEIRIAPPPVKIIRPRQKCASVVKIRQPTVEKYKQHSNVILKYISATEQFHKDTADPILELIADSHPNTGDPILDQIKRRIESEAPKKLWKVSCLKDFVVVDAGTERGSQKIQKVKGNRLKKQRFYSPMREGDRGGFNGNNNNLFLQEINIRSYKS
jgi:hypothetical protein